MMQSCTKTFDKEGGNATQQTPCNGWTLISVHFHFMLGKIQTQITLQQLVMCIIIGLEQTLTWLMKLTTYNTLSASDHDN